MEDRFSCRDLFKIRRELILPTFDLAVNIGSLLQWTGKHCRRALTSKAYTDALFHWAIQFLLSIAGMQMGGKA